MFRWIDGLLGKKTEDQNDASITRSERKKMEDFYNLGMDASFEEQFDHLVNSKSDKGELNLELIMTPIETTSYAYFFTFGHRLRAATSLYYLSVGTDLGITEERLSKIRELGVMLTGVYYHNSHPETPQETISKLREAKLMFIKARKGGAYGEACRDFLISYFYLWECSLTEEDLAFY